MGVEIPEATKTEVDATSVEQTSESQTMDTNKPTPVEKIAEENGVEKDTEPLESNKARKDAVDEWPEAKKIHNFFFVKYRSYEDPNLKKKIDIADKEIQKRSQARSEITEALRTKRSARAAIIERLRPLNDENKRYKEILGEKRKEKEPLQASLDELRNVIGSGRSGVSSKEELDDLIKSLHYRLNHESIPLAEEKQLIKEIKVLEEARGKMITNAPMMAKQDAIRDKVKLLGADMDGVRKEQQEIWTKIVRLQEELKPINDEITALEEELKSVSEKRDKAFETLIELRKSRDEGNSSYYKNRSLLNNAREIAAKKDITSLAELSSTEVEAFMSKWCSSKAIRADYEKRILASLDNRLLSRDGRMRNFDEKPILEQASQASKVEAEPVKVNVKQAKGEIKAAKQSETIPVSKAAPKVTSNSVVENREEVPAAAEKAHSEKPATEISKPKEIDAAKLKEMKREEEIAKAKLAMERKKRQAEKAAAKAAVRAQKEAEKKLKEKEKKAKKKVGGTSLADTPDEPVEEDVKASEDDAPAAADVHVTAAKKGPKENIRYRNLSKNQNQIPKVLLKRKKSQSYWYWTVAGTGLALLLLVALGWYYSSVRN